MQGPEWAVLQQEPVDDDILGVADLQKRRPQILAWPAATTTGLVLVIGVQRGKPVFRHRIRPLLDVLLAHRLLPPRSAVSIQDAFSTDRHLAGIVDIETGMHRIAPLALPAGEHRHVAHVVVDEQELGALLEGDGHVALRDIDRPYLPDTFGDDQLVPHPQGVNRLVQRSGIVTIRPFERIDCHAFLLFAYAHRIICI